MKGPPVNGPRESDTAVSEFRHAGSEDSALHGWRQQGFQPASAEIVEAARRSFGYVDLTDPRYLGFPAQLALSFGTLAIQSALRGLVSYEVVGPSRYPEADDGFLRDVHRSPCLYRPRISRTDGEVSCPACGKSRRPCHAASSSAGLWSNAVSTKTPAAHSNPSPEIPLNYTQAMHDAAVALYRAGNILMRRKRP